MQNINIPEKCILPRGEGSVISGSKKYQLRAHFWGQQKKRPFQAEQKIIGLTEFNTMVRQNKII